MANSLMEHPPPSGWSDVARTNDIDRVEAEMRDGFKSVRNTMRFVVGLMLTGAGGMIVLLIQLNQSISALK